MRRAAKIDANHKEVVAALRKFGASVQTLATVGKGCPDLLVGYCGSNFVFEVKDGSKKASERRLNPDQLEWAAGWKGTVHTVTSAEHAIQTLLECTY